MNNADEELTKLRMIYDLLSHKKNALSAIQTIKS